MSEPSKRVVPRFLVEVFNGQRFDLLPDLVDTAPRRPPRTLGK